MHDLAGFGRDTLYVVAGLAEPHGLALTDEGECYYKGELHHGRLYQNLDTLVEIGLFSRASSSNGPTGTNSRGGDGASSTPSATGGPIRRQAAGRPPATRCRSAGPSRPLPWDAGLAVSDYGWLVRYPPPHLAFGHERVNETRKADDRECGTCGQTFDRGDDLMQHANAAHDADD